MVCNIILIYVPYDELTCQAFYLVGIKIILNTVFQCLWVRKKTVSLKNIAKRTYNSFIHLNLLLNENVLRHIWTEYN